jgi:hypothetical protein
VTEPAKLMFPFIAVARACWLKSPQLSMPVVRIARSVFDSFISFIWGYSSLNAKKHIQIVRHASSMSYDLKFTTASLCHRIEIVRVSDAK